MRNLLEKIKRYRCLYRIKRSFDVFSCCLPNRKSQSLFASSNYTCKHGNNSITNNTYLYMALYCKMIGWPGLHLSSHFLYFDLGFLGKKKWISEQLQLEIATTLCSAAHWATLHSQGNLSGGWYCPSIRWFPFYAKKLTLTEVWQLLQYSTNLFDIGITSYVLKDNRRWQQPESAQRMPFMILNNCTCCNTDNQHKPRKNK